MHGVTLRDLMFILRQTSLIFRDTEGFMSLKAVDRGCAVIRVGISRYHSGEFMQEIPNLPIKYYKTLKEEDELPPENLAIANLGRQDLKKHLEEHVSNWVPSNMVQTLSTVLDTVVF